MTLKTSTKHAQQIMHAEFVFNITDTMVNVAAAADEFASVAAHVFDVIDLPPNAIVVGGDLVTNTLVGGATAYNVKVGDVDSDVRYLGTTDKIAAGRTALVPTGYVGTGQPIRLTVTPTVAPATSGKLTLRVHFVLDGRANEVM